MAMLNHAVASTSISWNARHPSGGGVTRFWFSLAVFVLVCWLF